MTGFSKLMSLVIDFLKTPIEFGDYHFSAWGVFIFVCLALIVTKFIRDFFS